MDLYYVSVCFCNLYLVNILSRPRYYDYDGNPITLDEWCQLFEARATDPDLVRWRVAETVITDEIRVSTVWLGLDHNLARVIYEDSEPHIFETMVFGGPMDGECRRYSSAEEAEKGHYEVVEEVKLALQVEEVFPHGEGS